MKTAAFIQLCHINKTWKIICQNISISIRLIITTARYNQCSYHWNKPDITINKLLHCQRKLWLITREANCYSSRSSSCGTTQSYCHHQCIYHHITYHHLHRRSLINLTQFFKGQDFSKILNYNYTLTQPLFQSSKTCTIPHQRENIHRTFAIIKIRYYRKSRWSNYLAQSNCRCSKIIRKNSTMSRHAAG